MIFIEIPIAWKNLQEVLKMLEAINYEEREILLMSDGENGSHWGAKKCYAFKEKSQFKNYNLQKVRDHCYLKGKGVLLIGLANCENQNLKRFMW